MDTGLSGKSVLVFASSKGLGKASAKLYAEAGADVMLTSRTEKNCQEAAEELRRTASGRVSYFVCDVSRGEDVQKAVACTAEQFGGLDVLVNNAGGPPPGTFEETTEEDWAFAWELTLMSGVRAIRAALPYLKTSAGKIITITSSSMKEPVDGLLLSNVYRTGIVGLTKSLAKEFGQYGILVNAVGPGRIDTERVRQLDGKKAAALGEDEADVRRNNAAQIPLGRYGEPEEFARTVLFLGSGWNTYVTGQHFLADGGVTNAY